MISYLLSRLGILSTVKCDSAPQKPTHYEYAVLCQQTYQTAGGAPPSDWRVIHSRYHDNEMGFAAATYQNDKKKAVVIAFRGSHNVWNWVATAFLSFSQLPSTFGYAEMHVKESIKRAPKGYDVSSTGHSLGAVIAEITACRFRIPAVTFESPGSRHMIEADSKHSQSPEEADITTYLAAPNTVNTLNPQTSLVTGKLFRLYIPHLSEEQKSLSRMMALSRMSLYLNPMFWIYADLEKLLFKTVEITDAASWVLNQHDIGNIIKQFDPVTGEPVLHDRVVSWPSMLSKTMISAMFLLKLNNPIEALLNSMEWTW